MRPLLTVSALMSLSLAACGNPDTPGGRAADARHQSFEQIGDAFKSVTKELKAGTTDIAKVQAGAATLNDLAGKLPGWFPAGSGPADGMKTEASPAVWAKPAEFKAEADKFAAAAATFNSVAKAGDKATIAAAAGEFGKSCKNCHEKFREE